MHLNRLDLNLLVALNALLSEKNVTKAAERVFISQPAMSGALQRLRENFNDPLLVRVGRSMELSPKAHELIQPVSEILLKIDNIMNADVVFDPSRARRTFTIAMTDFVALTLMPGIINHALEKAKGVQFIIRPIAGSFQDELQSGNIDLIIRADVKYRKISKSEPDYFSEPLFSDEWVCVADINHPTLEDTLSLEQYLSLPHASLHFGVGTGTMEEVSLMNMSLDTHVQVAAHSFSNLAFLISGTPLISLLPKKLALILQKKYSLKIFTPPIDIPMLRENMIWLGRFNEDPGHKWLRSIFLDAAKKFMA